MDILTSFYSNNLEHQNNSKIMESLVQSFKKEQNSNYFDNKSTDQPDKILNNLYLGNLMNASDKEALKKIGITHILIFASYIEPFFPTDFIYKIIEIHDLPTVNIEKYFNECHK